MYLRKWANAKQVMADSQAHDHDQWQGHQALAMIISQRGFRSNGNNTDESGLVGLPASRKTAGSMAYHPLAINEKNRMDNWMPV